MPTAQQRMILLSVRPQYASKLVTGQKTAELRRSRPSLETPFTALVYSSAPVKRVVGAIRVVTVVSSSPELIWRKYREALCVSASEFSAYAGAARTLCCWVIDKALPFDAPRALSDERPPRSFRYISADHPLSRSTL